jgi:hypothetical protein
MIEHRTGTNKVSGYFEHDKFYDMETPQQMDERLWDFIDGRCSEQERAVIGSRIADDPVWQRRYREFLQLNLELHQQELEGPSLRFTKNVMDQIAHLQVAPATRNYINRHVIFGIVAFFFTLITGVIVYLAGKTQWAGNSSDNFLSSHHLSPDNLNWGGVLGSLPVNVFMLVNVVLGLFLLDNYLQRRKKSRHGDATMHSSGS